VSYHFAPAVSEIGLVPGDVAFALCGRLVSFYYTTLADCWRMSGRVVRCPECVEGTWIGVGLAVGVARRILA
jgi:hypothetical protein